MARAETKKAMSEAAQDAKAINRLSTAGLGKKELASLKAKYGARAYDLIYQAVMYPDKIRQILGWEKFKKSSAVIKYMIENTITPKQVEKITGKGAEVVRNTAPKSEGKETKDDLKQQRAEYEKKAAEEKKRAEEAAKKKAAEEKKRAEEAAKKKAAEEKKRAEEAAKKKAAEEKKRAEEERKAAQEKISQRKTNTPAPQSINKSAIQVSDTLKCQIEQKTIDTKDGPKTVFISSVTDLQGVTIPELPGTTKDSLWRVAFDREADKKNPVGGGTKYLGAMQYSDEGVRNIALYALTKPEYKNIAQKFFKPGYEKALKKFQEYVKKEGNNKAYWHNSTEKTALLKYLKKDGSEYRTIFRNEGKINAPQFLQLQRDFASEIYLAQTKDKYVRIVAALKKHNMKPENLDPKIWSMVFASAIHQKTYLNAIVNIFETMQYTTYENGKKVVKKIKDLNSVEMIDAIAAVDSSTFGSGSGKTAYENARRDFSEKNSATTCRELSIILDDPRIFEEHEQLITQNVTKVNGQYIAKANASTMTASNDVRSNSTRM